MFIAVYALCGMGRSALYSPYTLRDRDPPTTDYQVRYGLSQDYLR